MQVENLPPPSGPANQDRQAKGGGSGSDASVTSRAVFPWEPDIVAISRRMITGQRVDWSWLVDTGASEDIASMSDKIKSRILMKTLEAPSPFIGVGGTVYADDACRDLYLEDLGFNFSPSVVK